MDEFLGSIENKYGGNDKPLNYYLVRSTKDKMDKLCELIKNNSYQKNFDIFVSFRDSVMHLNVVTCLQNSLHYFNKFNNLTYFGLYNVLIQNIIQNKLNVELKQNTIDFDKIFRTQNGEYYSKSFLRKIIVPFAYNFARYKMLSDENVFNKYINIGQESK